MTSEIPSAASTTRTTRRPRGEPRRLLLDAARDLFARQDYRSTTTRDIAEAAGVAEHLIFRNFGSKAALFHQALVVPFTNFVDDFSETWRSVDPARTDEEELAGQFVGQLYDLFVARSSASPGSRVKEFATRSMTSISGITQCRNASSAVANTGALGSAPAADAIGRSMDRASLGSVAAGRAERHSPLRRAACGRTGNADPPLSAADSEHSRP